MNTDNLRLINLFITRKVFKKDKRRQIKKGENITQG